MQSFKNLRAVLTLTAVFWACSPAPPTTAGLWVASLDDEETFKAMSTEGGGLMQIGRSLKFLIDNETTPKKVYFVNSNFTVNGVVPDFAKFHYSFAQWQLSVSESVAEFNQAVYRTQSKRYMAGSVHTFELGPSGEVTYGVELFPDDAAAEETIVEILTALKPALKIPGAKYAFVATGVQQSFARVKDTMASLGFGALTIDEVLGSVKYLPMNLGECWGYLRLFPKDSAALRPTDIPVFDELPLDLSVVAGTITVAFQDVNSHVNLKSKERGTPNMVLRDAGPEHPELKAYIDKPVHLVVNRDGFKIEGSTDALIASKLEARLSKAWHKLEVVSETRLAAFDEMCGRTPADCLSLTSRYGGKSAGLGFLSNPNVVGSAKTPGTLSARVGYDIVPKGFGVPVQWYRDFVAANPDLRRAIEALIAKEQAGVLSPAERGKLAADVQRLFYAASFAREQLDVLRKRIAEAFPGIRKIKVRSSSNAEDIPNFDGAGLYDSFAAKLDEPDAAGPCTIEKDKEGGPETKLKVKPKSVACAVKAVYASLWNPRAIEERSFARLDHATSAMGLALVVAYDSESEVAANAVLITRVVNADNIYGYSISIQDGNNLVTNPAPRTQAQVSVANMTAPDLLPRFSITRFAKPKADGPIRSTPVLSETQMILMVDIAKAVEIAYCSARTSYFSGDCRVVYLGDEKPISLDMEFKVLENGHFVLKQVREFHGR